MSSGAGHLRWAVKHTFLDYIKGMSDGKIEVFDGCVEDAGEFIFPLESFGDGGVHFSGGVRFTAFAGMLDVRLTDPMVEGSGETAKLTALVGPASIAARATIAEIPTPGPHSADEPWSATPQLTFEGVRIFGDVYQVGTELAPLVFEHATD